VIYRVEVSSVNRKQGEIMVNLPRDLAGLEGEVRSMISERVTRGRVNFTLACERSGEGKSRLLVDEDLAEQYLAAIVKLTPDVAVSAGDLIRAPGVFSVEEAAVEPEEAWEGTKESLGMALSGLMEMREAEGAHLKEDLSEKLDGLEREIAAIGKLAPEVVRHYRKALMARLEEAGLELPLDDERLVKEIGIFAERSDITEEITRLGSHFSQFRTYLESGEPVGRSMDFLCQEVHREINTIGSKANSAGIAQHVVTAKAELEKMREQVQNVE
jgi:uncharacterized protein (TIGR00255 family)